MYSVCGVPVRGGKKKESATFYLNYKNKQSNIGICVASLSTADDKGYYFKLINNIFLTQPFSYPPHELWF